jgi:hypothetical protein
VEALYNRSSRRLFGRFHSDGEPMRRRLRPATWVTAEATELPSLLSELEKRRTVILPIRLSLVRDGSVASSMIASQRYG